jgi:hypothetical protein
VKIIFGCFLGLVLLSISIAPSFAQSPAATDAKLRPTITVRMRNYTQIPSFSLARAEELASEILREAGVQVVWLDCYVALAAEERQPGCAQPLGSTDFVLNLVDKIQVLSPKLQESTLGLALVPPDAGQGYTAYISYRHARDVAQKGSVAVERVLAVGAAHELGHLLLGENAHSPSGIMKIWWGADELKLGLNWNMWFTPQQSQRIRSNVLARGR